ncbi:hypothetical protein GCM10027586_00130 [Kineococcus gypseus]|uniref:hypothetical protein n=1 Tax=Kineococcus gypseus TaxID=1637102 RepID=UPI003D7C9917
MAAVVVAVAGYLVTAVVLRLWMSWPDALLWALVGAAGWFGADVVSAIEHRRAQHRARAWR